MAIYLKLGFKRSTVSWNAMISADCRGSWMNEALVVLKEMRVRGFEPISSTFVAILSGYSSLGSHNFACQGLSIHCYLIKLGLVYVEISLPNSLMTMYISINQIDGARKVFDMMDEKSVISWTTIIGGYVKVGDAAEAFVTFKQMHCQGIGMDSVVFVNLISGCIQVGDLRLASSVHSLILKSGYDADDSLENLLITMYAKCGDLALARRIFDVTGEKSIFSWTSMIGGYAHSAQPGEALNLFRMLLKTDIRPNEATLATILFACADLGSLIMGKEIEEYVLQNVLESDNRIQTSLIHMYSKSGSIKKAREVFDRVGDKDLGVWTSMINSYAIHGNGKEAIALFHKMKGEEGIMPDAIAFTSILQACSHSGLVEDGLKFFKSMRKDFGIEPTVEHYTCLVDILGRVGQLNLALEAIQDMPLEAQSRAWSPLLSACRIHGNIELGELASRKLLEMNPGKSGGYILMANLYTSSGKWKEADRIRRLINDKGLIKECGWSQVEIDGEFYAFAAGEQSHLQLAVVPRTLEQLSVALIEACCTAETMKLNGDL